MKAKEYLVLTRAVDEALQGAIPRFDKHRDKATVPLELQGELADFLADAVTSGICEWFDFDTPEAEG